MTEPDAAARDPDQIKNILITREHARADAWLRKDRRALEALLAPDYIEVNSLGRFTRQELLERIFPVLTLHTFVIENPEIQITGDKTAVLSYECRERLTAGKREIQGTFRVNATYSRDGRQYRLSFWEIRPEE